MPFLEELSKFITTLKESGIKLPDINFSLIKITNTTTTNITDSSKNLTLPLETLKETEKGKLKKLLPLALEENYTFIQEDSKELIEDIKEKERDPAAQEELNFLKEAVPSADYNIWRAALYMRSHSLKSRQARNDIKDQIVEKYGKKGKNIANLCSAGYLKEYLIPLYEEIRSNSDPEKAREVFGKAYRKIVDELPFTIFVNFKMKVPEILKEIEFKRNYGIKFINIHGISQVNIEKIKKAVKALEDNKKHLIQKNVRENNNIILVEINFINEKAKPRIQTTSQ